MSFDEAARNDAERKLALALREALERPEYAHNSFQVWDNLDSDRQLPAAPPPDLPATLQSLLKHLMAPGGAAPASLQKETEDFARRHGLEGEPDPPAAGRDLGHVHRLESLNRPFAPSRP